MLDRLEHRGPDHRGIHTDPNDRFVLGHTRLAIMDPAGGQQPLVAADGSAVVGNGEIYNCERLRSEIGSEFQFRTGSDSEVLLPLFHRHGPSMVERLDGMFAFVATDGSSVVAARDRVGIKPLYRGEKDGAVAFASELKALVGSWNSIKEIPPGHAWVNGSLVPYYRLPPAEIDGPSTPEAIDDWVEELRAALERAVRKRLMSDVPVGAFLSGGIDSSIVAALAARHVSELATFALGFEGSEDLAAARRVSDHVGTRHHEIVVSPDEAESVLPEVIYHLEHYDQDLVRSAVPCYLVARFAAEHLKVVLTGEGADELFAGYRYHRDYRHDPTTLQRELRRSVAAMHNSNLQRVDRMTMAHGLEARVPFLDPEVIALALRIPAELKLRQDSDGRTVEKWVLREAFSDLLPPDIVWRAKSQFDEGSGAGDRLAALAVEARQDLGDHRSATMHSCPRIRSDEEAWYFDLLRGSFTDWRTICANTSVWTEGRLAPMDHVGSRAVTAT